MAKRFLLLILVIESSLLLSAQTMTENDYIRKGNKLYADSLFEKAEIEYRKALESNPLSVDAMYNLGNALFNQISQSQEKGKEAMEQYTAAAKVETQKERLAQIYHNLGTLMYMAQQYPQSVEAYKEAMRNNPYDHETRYNLAKAMYMCRPQEQQQENQNQQQENKEQQEQQQEQQNQQQQEQQPQNQESQNQQQEDKEQQNQQQAQENKNQISKENAEQILNALMQDEREIQEKQKKMMKQQQGKILEKDW